MRLHILEECNNFLKKLLMDQNGTQSFNVLEAGGGSFSHFYIPENAHTICLDISFGQLSRNKAVENKIQGDVEYLPVNMNRLDMIVCFNVIEHLENPALALEQLYYALKKKGILLIGCPERNSLKGYITRLTPLFIHRWYYRFIVGKKDRGEGHNDAFYTHFKSIVSEKKLRLWLNDKKMKIHFLKSYDGAAAYKLVDQTWKARLFSVPYYSTAFIIKVLSFGLWQPTLSDILIVAEKSD